MTEPVTPDEPSPIDARFVCSTSAWVEASAAGDRDAEKAVR